MGIDLVLKATPNISGRSILITDKKVYLAKDTSGYGNEIFAYSRSGFTINPTATSSLNLTLEGYSTVIRSIKTNGSTIFCGGSAGSYQLLWGLEIDENGDFTGNNSQYVYWTSASVGALNDILWDTIGVVFASFTDTNVRAYTFTQAGGFVWKHTSTLDKSYGKYKLCTDGTYKYVTSKGDYSINYVQTFSYSIVDGFSVVSNSAEAGLGTGNNYSGYFDGNYYYYTSGGSVELRLYKCSLSSGVITRGIYCIINPDSICDDGIYLHCRITDYVRVVRKSDMTIVGSYFIDSIETPYYNDIEFYDGYIFVCSNTSAVNVLALEVVAQFTTDKVSGHAPLTVQFTAI